MSRIKDNFKQSGGSRSGSGSAGSGTIFVEAEAEAEAVEAAIKSTASASFIKRLVNHKKTSKSFLVQIEKFRTLI